MKRDLVVFGLSFAVLVASIPLSVIARNLFKSNKKSTRRKADDAGASSSSAASAGSDNYDVFLSFSGRDTRKTFGDHLYKGLVDAGIRVFRDDNELREGEKIGDNLFQAIKKSKISIPILSQNYPSSQWCLQELVEMTECIERAGHVVLPIFYRVEPAHVRYQIGSFGETFSRLSEKHCEEDVKKWKQALQEVASLKGWEPERIADGHEAELVKEVVRKVLSELKKAFQLVVTEQLVGIDNAVEDVLRLLNDKPDATQIVGIYGMGGIGKTTLAKFVYNKLSDQFQDRSFIADIRESSKGNDILRLQKQLISDILRTDDQVSNTDVAIRIMESRFKYKKVLILLDDVDDKDQIQTLVRKHDCFEMGSKIIITTRISSVLYDEVVDYKYELKELAEDKSFVLFSRHAFRRDSPPREFESLSRAVVSTTGGLPIALEVIGSFLCGRKRESWQDALEKLAPHKKVQEKLKISYDALDHLEKQIFLDIACFFNRTNLRVTSHLWEACNFLPNMGIETLSFMSLVKIEEGELRMHDQLKDLGREIVRQEDYNIPMNRSRLWVHEEAWEALQINKEKVKDRVQAIRFFENSRQRELTTEQFETLPNLRFLAVNGAKLIGDSKGLLPKLRCLVWIKCPASMVTSFHLEKLVILTLGGSDISELWDGWSHLKVAKQLKVLGLPYCHRLKVIPDFSTFRNLEMLNLEGCDNLEEIHPSIGEVKGLVFLNLQGCEKLKELPKEMGKLEKLEQLFISKTAIEEIPPFIGFLKRLEMLIAQNCKSLVRLPDSISHLVNLLHLDLSGCSKLCRIPECIESLVKLHHLSLERVGIPEDSHLDHALFHIPNSIGKLEWLTKLNMSCSGICELPESIGDLKNLKILNIAYSEKLSSLPSTISKLGNLEVFDATKCKSLGGEIHIDGLSSLKILRLSGTHVSGFPDAFNKLSRLQKLEELDATDCKSLGGEIPINGLSSLKILRLSSTGVSSFPDAFDELYCLKELTLHNCKMLQSLPQSISKLSSLQYLKLTSCDNLHSLPELPAYLIVLEVTCQHRTLPQFSHLIHLKGLTVKDCRLLESMPKLPTGLLRLRVHNCVELKELQNLSSLGFLSLLDLYSCSELTEIKGLEGLKSLANLYVFRCSKLSNLDGLEHLESLRCLGMGLFSESNAPLLNDDLVQVRGLDKLKNLEELLARDCQSLVRPDLSQLTHLKRLDICGCHNLVEIKGLERLKNLKRLDIEGCRSIATLPDLSCFDNLKDLNISGCSKLRDVRGLEKVEKVYKRGIQLRASANCPHLSNFEI